ncbi:MAG: hypothetical protein A2Z18_05650 [Armatimonadetes bacterium RBG_16_58_9]|nr:MAG: hypothetical protein A2Z18_05650 [Armatimonadetes bacterium RBG_16_58_9]
MKDIDDLVRGWLRKAGSDLLALDATFAAEAYDAACFHAQQSAEKFLKAFLVHNGVEFPYTHNLSRLVELCGSADESFSTLMPVVEPLTPFAVELRYDSEFWPTREVAAEARTSAQGVRDLVMSRLGAYYGKGL